MTDTPSPTSRPSAIGRFAALAVASLTIATSATFGQIERATHIVIPQTRGFALNRQDQSVDIETVKANVRILEHTAATTLDIFLRNPMNRQAEAVVLLPVPRESVVSAFLFEGQSTEPTAELLPADEARRVYDSIVNQVRDPALLEFAGYNLIRSSVFPVPANGTQRVRLTYEHILEGNENRIDYVLPRSESLQVSVPWEIEIDIKGSAPISMIYSPSHTLTTKRRSGTHLTAKIATESMSQPGPFIMSYLLEREGVTASMFAYPDPKVGGGYFLMLAGLPAKISDREDAIQREVTVVIDRSGSMAGGKMDQVKAAALQVIEGLEDGEAFNIIDYATNVKKFAPAPVIKDEATTLRAREYLTRIRTTGGTNIHDALLEALRQDKTDPDMLPIVLFLTDGLPTVGRTSEVTIRELVTTANTHDRRIFSLGVGNDVNVPLLDRIADSTRAVTQYILPEEDVELKVAQVFKRLYGPVLANVSLETVDSSGNASTDMVAELMPASVPDVFEGDQVVLLGQYTNEAPITFRLSGDFLGQQRSFRFDFDFSEATTRNSFVPRLWAGRRIAYLVDQIRQAGASTSVRPLTVDETLVAMPEYQELVDEILRLSTEFGVLSEYTSFLATEGTDLGDWEGLIGACSTTLDTRAVQTRSGLAAVNQGVNFNEQKLAAQLDYKNSYWDANMNRVEVADVQNMADCTFFKRGTQWIDARVVNDQSGKTLDADRTVNFGSEEHIAMLEDLIGQGRQGILSLTGDIVIRYKSENVLVVNSITAGN